MKIPERMWQVSVWALWGGICFLGFSWLIFAVLKFYGVLSSAADWVQAIGSVVAIAAAGTFPFIHEAAKEKRAADQLRSALLSLAQSHFHRLAELRDVLSRAQADFGAETINPYLVNGKYLEWGPHAEALRAIPIHLINPVYIPTLGQMKSATAFAQSICERLPEWSGWDVWGDREAAEVQRLNMMVVRAQLAVEMLEVEISVVSVIEE